MYDPRSDNRPSSELTPQEMAAWAREMERSKDPWELRLIADGWEREGKQRADLTLIHRARRLRERADKGEKG